MKLFSPGGPGLSAVAKPRLGDTDQRACELLPRRARTIKPRRTDGTVSMDEFRHRSFAQVWQAEANVSLSAPRGRRVRAREVWSGKGRWFKVENQFGGGGGGLKRNRTRLTRRSSAPVAPQPPRTDPSTVPAAFASHPAKAKGVRGSFEPSFGNYYDPRHNHGSPQRSPLIALACVVKTCHRACARELLKEFHYVISLSLHRLKDNAACASARKTPITPISDDRTIDWFYVSLRGMLNYSCK